MPRKHWDHLDEEASREGDALSAAKRSGQTRALLRGKKHGKTSRESESGALKHTNALVRRIEKGTQHPT